MLRLVPLGTNGYFPSQGRQTTSFLLLTDEAAVLIDAGSGVGRLLEPAIAELLRPYPRLDVVFTHYHLDHVVGLSFFLAVWRERPVGLHGPAPPLVDGTPEAMLAHLLDPPVFPFGIDRFPMPVEVRRFTGEPFTVAGLEVRTRRQHHPGGSAALRFGDRFVFATDTAIDPATADFARGVPLLLHEVWSTDGEARRLDPGPLGHSAAGPVARLARAAGVARLMPIHHHPARTDADLAALARAIAAEAGGVEVTVPDEGAIYTLD